MKWSLLVFFVVQTASELGVAGSVMKKKVDEPPKTYFENAPQNVFASAGQNVLLPCRVRHLNDKVVSWIRMRDLHILTSATLLFTNDGRFGIHHPFRDSAVWNLQIKDISPKDMGSYECQVNTEPKIKFLVNLTVFESDVMISDMGEVNVDDGNGDNSKQSDETAAKTSIYEPSESRINIGGSITFTCKIGLVNSSQHTFQWYHDDKLMNSGKNSNVDTERLQSSFSSTLRLTKVTSSDSGKYSCMMYNKNFTTFKLHVISPALQDGLKSRGPRHLHSVFVLLLLIINCIARSTVVF